MAGTKCIQYYAEARLSFLVDDALDALHTPEPDTLEETDPVTAGLKLISEWPQHKQRDALYAYDQTRQHLKAFLADFARTNTVVTKEAIDAWRAAKKV